MALPPSPSPLTHADDVFQSTSNSRPGPSRLPQSGLSWENGVPLLRMQDAVVETVVTHTTRTTTSFAPLPLPKIPTPESLSLPTHLPAERYPLALAPTPEDMRFFSLNLGGRRVVVQEEGCVIPATNQRSGPGWTRTFMTAEQFKSKDIERIDVLGAVSNPKGKEIKKRPHSSFKTSFTRDLDSSYIPTPPINEHAMGPTPQRSPPRKRVRGLDNLSMPHDGPLLSPLPSPDHEVGPSLAGSAVTSPSIGSGNELAALYSLPSIVSHFDTLPDKLQQHVLMHLLRRSRMPTIQRISVFAGSALKRDFISELPHELAVQILRKVDSISLATATRVCKKWKHMIDSERSIWKQRLIDDDMWCGLGVEEEEEKLIRSRYEILEEQADFSPSKAGTPGDDHEMADGKDVALGLPRELERVVPLKHVYRRRYCSNRNWFQGEPEHTSFPGHGTNVVTCLQFDEDKIISASDDHSVNVYDTRTGQLRKRLDGHEGGVWALEYKGDTLVTGSTDRSIRVWDLETYTQSHIFLGHTSTVRCLQIVEPVFEEATGEYQPPYPLIVTGSRDASVRVWKLPKKGEPAYRFTVDGVDEPAPPEHNPYHLHNLEGHTLAVRALAAHGRYCVSGSYDNSVRVWDIVKGACIHTLTGHDSKVYSIVFDRHRMRCASGSMDNTVKVWDVITGECLSTLMGHTSLVGLLDISPNFIVSAAADSSLRIWDADSQELKQILATHGGAITCFQHDESKIVSGSDGMLKLWNIRSGFYVRDLVIGISSVWQVAFNGNLLVAASNRQGNTVFDVFDFGKVEHCSGIDNDDLDKLRRPPWERDNPFEPQAYQSDEIEMGDSSPLFYTEPGPSNTAGGNRRGEQAERQSRRSTRLAKKAAGSGVAHGSQSGPTSAHRMDFPAAHTAHVPSRGTRAMAQAGTIPSDNFSPVYDSRHSGSHRLNLTSSPTHPPPSASRASRRASSQQQNSQAGPSTSRRHRAQPSGSPSARISRSRQLIPGPGQSFAPIMVDSDEDEDSDSDEPDGEAPDADDTDDSEDLDSDDEMFWDGGGMASGSNQVIMPGGMDGDDDFDLDLDEDVD